MPGVSIRTHDIPAVRRVQSNRMGAVAPVIAVINPRINHPEPIAGKADSPYRPSRCAVSALEHHSRTLGKHTQESDSSMRLQATGNAAHPSANGSGDSIARVAARADVTAIIRDCRGRCLGINPLGGGELSYVLVRRWRAKNLPASACHLAINKPAKVVQAGITVVLRPGGGGHNGVGCEAGSTAPARRKRSRSPSLCWKPSPNRPEPCNGMCSCPRSRHSACK